MDRRSFLAAAAALGAMPLFSHKVQAATKSAGLKITAVEIWRMTGNPEQYKVYQASEGHGTTRNLRPMPPSQLYMKILTNAKGVEGFYGTFEQSSADAAMGAARTIVGMDPLAIDAIWDRMHAGAHRYSGTYMFGVSTIDHCLWDLKGRFLDIPVYKLLGGSRNVIDVYGSCIGFPIGLDQIRERAAAVKKEGFKSQKWFPTLGPADGDSGFEQNVGMARVLRETLGEYYEFMIDPLLRWDLPYAMKWCKAVEQYHPLWLEEAVPTAGQAESLARLRQMTSIPIATGEHTYGRWEVNDLIKADAVDVIQVDPEWGGGISELLKICALASAHGLMVSPHNQRTIALAHLIASQPRATCPAMEYQVNIQPNLCYFEKNPLVPKNSQLELPDLPGFGIELDESKIVKREKIYPQP
jgi:L-rhamnonate dehydratase